MAGEISGKQLRSASITSTQMATGFLSADASGRALIATDFFDSATVTAKFASGAIALDRLSESVIQADGGQAFTADQSMGSNKLTNLASGTASTDAATKGQVDAAVAGLSWQEPASAKDYIGTRTVTEINALSPISGETVVAGAAGTPTATGSDTLAIGDVAEYQGSTLGWQIIVTNSGGFVPDGTRLLVADTTVADGLVSPLVDATDENKIAEFDGTSNTPATLTTSVDGYAALVIGEGSVNENIGWVYDTSATKYIQFTGASAATAGDGLTASGNAINVTAAGGADGAALTVAADSLAIDGDLVSIDETLTNITPDTGGLGADNKDLAAIILGIDNALGGLQLTGGDKKLTPAATTAPGPDSTGLTIAATPDGWVGIFVNNVGPYELGNAVKTTDCFFSADGGTTAKAIGAIASGDTLYWNGDVAGFDLDGTNDRMDFVYHS